MQMLSLLHDLSRCRPGCQARLHVLQVCLYMIRGRRGCKHKKILYARGMQLVLSAVLPQRDTSPPRGSWLR